MPIHSAPTSLSLRRPPRLSGDDQFSEEHAIMSPDPSTACNSAMGSSSIASILGPVEMLTRILIPNSKIGAVIGKGGSIIKKIRESSGAKITICGSCAGAPGSGGGANAADDSGDRMVTIVGLYLTVLAAFSAIVRQTEPVFGKRGTDEPTWGGGGHNSGSTCVRLLVPNNKAGGLIGRGGSTIRVIRDQSCARIEISTQGLAVAGGGLLDRIVTITGTYSAYIRAFKMICLQLADIPNSGILATSPTSQNDVVPGNGGTVRGGGVVNNTPTSQIHQQSQPGQQQQNLGYGIGMFRGNLALQFSPASQSGSPFHIPPGPSCRTQQSEQPKLLSSSGYAPPAAWANIAPDQGRVRRTSITTPTNSVGCLPHSLNGGRRRSSSTPDNYYSSSSPSFIADFTADVIRNIGLKYDEKMFNSSTTSSVPARCATSPTPIKITVDMDIPYEALTALRLDHGFSNIMNISGAVLEELQTPVSTSNGLHSSVGEVCVKGDDGIKRVEELGVEEFNKQECDSGKKDKCKEEGGQSDLLEHQEGTLPLEWVNDYSSGSISSSNISSVTSISTKSLGDSESSLDGVKDNAAFNGGCISSSNRISITGTLEVK